MILVRLREGGQRQQTQCQVHWPAKTEFFSSTALYLARQVQHKRGSQPKLGLPLEIWRSAPAREDSAKTFGKPTYHLAGLQRTVAIADTLGGSGVDGHRLSRGAKSNGADRRLDYV